MYTDTILMVVFDYANTTGLKLSFELKDMHIFTVRQGINLKHLTVAFNIIKIKYSLVMASPQN